MDDSEQAHAEQGEGCGVQDGLLFGLPVVLDTDSEDLKVGDTVLLTYQGADLAVLDIDAKYALRPFCSHLMASGC